MAARCMQPFLLKHQDSGCERQPCPKGDVCNLNLRQVLGFNGEVRCGLIIHTTGQQVIYPVGHNIVIEELVGPKTGAQQILTGHTNMITALALSHDGQFLASGQLISHESKAPIIMWDWCSKQKLMEWALHKTKVEALTFTCTNKHLISLGGQDDETIAVWSVLERKPVCGKVATLKRSGIMHCVAASKINESLFASAGDSYGRIWTYNINERTLDHIEFRFHALSRVIICMEIIDYESSKFPIIVCGTTSGDIMVFHGTGGALQCVVPTKQLSSGITSLSYTRMLDDNVFCLLVGTGECKMGYYTLTMSFVKGNSAAGKMVPYKGFKMWSSDRDSSAITSISKVGVGHQFYIGTKNCQIYRFSLAKWTAELVRTSSNRPVNSITFPRATDELMVVGEFENVRVFNLKIMLEVRRYFRANRNCHVVALSHDGTNIFTGWDNGETIILGFEPTGLGLREVYRIDSSQKQAVTALSLTSTSDLLVTGGNDAQCRVWRLVTDLDSRCKKLHQGLLLYTMLDQSGPITSIRVSDDDKMFISTSVDGTAAIYNLTKGLRQLLVKVNNSLTGADFLTDNCQFIVSGASGKIFIYEVSQWQDLHL
ncbi:cilia- and flagella-associated protein 52-like [Physella acuta]|uniref:cilia- and flagella-associated protein 52-like n=1 Tax=Physella acuta TaxID=109671 RepID=UPI0027DBAEC3|nr:cilia- and flagella-associated protein 52-like [Physella acuta]